MTQPGDVVARPQPPEYPAENTVPSDPPVADPPAANGSNGANGTAGPDDSAAAAVREGSKPPFHPTPTNVDAGFFTWDIVSGEVVCDPFTYRMHGLPEDPSATMDTFLSKVPEPDLPQLREAMERMVAAAGTYQLEYRVAGPDGGLRTMEVRGRVMPGPDGRPSRMMGMVVDITTIRATRDAEQRRLREVADRARRMHEFTASLASALTVNAIVDAAQAGIAAYGADSLLLVAERDGELKIAASCGLDDDCVEALSGLTSDKPAPISVAIQWSAPVYISSPAILAEDFPHLVDRLAGASQQSWVALPVRDSRGQVGACLFGFSDPREFRPEEKAQLFAASALLALSLERARMHEWQGVLASELQRGVLPRGQLFASGMTIATRYRPAAPGVEIGGDFYDVVELADGRVALVIGDVEGHNLIAASLMGRLRTTVHAYAREGHGPAEVMARANQWLAELNTDPDLALFATCCFVVVNPATRELAICRAGHPPALVVPPGGRPKVLDCEAALPLGIDPDAEYATTQTVVEPGSILVLTTDGLMVTDSADEHNLSSVLAVLRLGSTDDLEVLADDLLSLPRRQTRHADDVALLLARVDVP
ncbi:MAG TPA: SpoIIE family protein phosphatase [Streptosporangiaceae bacterium]